MRVLLIVLLALAVVVGNVVTINGERLPFVDWWQTAALLSAGAQAALATERECFITSTVLLAMIVLTHVTLLAMKYVQ